MYNFDVDSYLKTVRISKIKPKLWGISFILPFGGWAYVSSQDSIINLRDMDVLREAIKDAAKKIRDWHYKYKHGACYRIVGGGESLASYERDFFLLCDAWNKLPDVEPFDSFTYMQEVMADERV